MKNKTKNNNKKQSKKTPDMFRIREESKSSGFQGRTQGGVQGVQVNPPFFKLIIFIAWLGMHI